MADSDSKDDNNEFSPEDFLTYKKAIESFEGDPLKRRELAYQIWWRWADFHLYIISPTIDEITPPILIPPEPVDEDNELEFVYNILDAGYKLSTSKGEQMYTSGMSMNKMYNTIEKIFYILAERLKTGGYDDGTEVQVAFQGFELSQRKAFETVVNFPEELNVIVSNYDPGPWGETFLRNVKRLADKGYGYPKEAPRDTFRHGSKETSKPKKP